MKKFRTLGLAFLLLAVSHSFAVDPCYRGTEYHISYQTFCSEVSLFDAYQMAAVQTAIYRAQYSDPVYYYTLSIFQVGGFYYLSVEFVRCKKGAIAVDDPVGKRAFSVEDSLTQLEEDGWLIGEIHQFKDGGKEVLVTNSENYQYRLVFNKIGVLAHIVSEVE